MTDADLSATLSGTGKRHHHGHTSNPRRDYCSADNQDWPCDVASLLAALEAVLKLADDWEADAAAIARRVEGHAARGDGHAAAFARGSAEALDDCVRTLREEITRELSGTRRTQPGEDGES